MARFPGAIWRPIASAYLPNRRMAAYNRMNLHVAVSEASSLHGYFNGAGRASSHFYVRRDGTVEQYVDTAWQAEADLDGNDATISVETQGGVRNAQGEPWTPAQIDSLSRLFAWAVAVHGLEPRLASDSRVGASSKGLSWHRLGIDPWRVAGGMRYSRARGKVCPGDAKIAQIPTILARAQATLADNPVDGPGRPDIPDVDVERPDPLDTLEEYEHMERDIEALYEHRLGRKASRSEVNSWIDVAIATSLETARKQIVGSDEALRFDALPEDQKAAKRLAAAAQPKEPAVPVTVDAAALAVALVAEIRKALA